MCSELGFIIVFLLSNLAKCLKFMITNLAFQKDITEGWVYSPKRTIPQRYSVSYIYFQSLEVTNKLLFTYTETFDMSLVRQN